MDTREQELTVQDVWKLFRETQRESRETDRKFAETREAIHELSGEVSGLTQGLKKTR